MHVPLHDKAAVKCALRAIEIIRPEIIIHIGDLAEFEGASHWKWRKKKRPPLEYQLRDIDRDIADANAMLDRIDAVAEASGVQKKYFCQGNHDEWLDRVVEENPFLATTSHRFGTGYKFEDAMSLHKRGWKFYRLGDMLKIGHLYFYHGYSVSGIYHARQHLLKMGVNVMYGDKHDIQNASITHIDSQKSAWCIGCLKRLDRDANEWLKGKPHNWGHAFATVDWFGKDFSVNVHRIIKGRVSVHGELINGNK